MDPGRRPFFTADEEDGHGHGGMEAAAEARFSGYGTSQGPSHSLDDHHHHLNPFFSSRPASGSLRSVPFRGSPSVSSQRSGMFFHEPRFEDQRPHFLASCALCEKPLGNHKDIFMYRGDTAFCSEECRQEQMEMDEAKEKNRSISSLRKKDQKKSSNTSPSKSKDCSLRTGTVAAA